MKSSTYVLIGAIWLGLALVFGPLPELERPFEAAMTIVIWYVSPSVLIVIGVVKHKKTKPTTKSESP